MPRNLRDAYIALRDRLLTIRRASGYYHDVLFVELRDVAPGEPGAPGTLPYVCMPCLDMANADSYPDVQSGSVRVRVHQPIVVYLPTNDSKDIEHCSATDAFDWADDILRAVMPADSVQPWNLGSASVADVEPISKQVVVHSPDGMPPHVRIILAIDVIQTRAVLGPDGD